MGGSVVLILWKQTHEKRRRDMLIRLANVHIPKAVETTVLCAIVTGSEQPFTNFLPSRSDGSHNMRS